MTQLNRQKLAAYVRTKRGNKSLHDVAKMLGNVSISTLSRVEAGKNINVETYFALCDWLEVPPQWFFQDIATVSVPNDIEYVEHALRTNATLGPDVVDAIMRLIRVIHKNEMQ